MSIETTNPLNALLFINNGVETGRWNFPAAENTPIANPGGLGTGVSLTYSFLVSRPAYATADEVRFAAMNSAQQAATAKALAAIAEVVDITFTKVAAQDGQLTFGTTDQDDLASAWAYSPFYSYTPSGGDITEVQEHDLAGSVWVNNDPRMGWTAADWQPGAFGYEVLLHEMGHALGLNHSFEGDGAGGGFVLPQQLDNTAHTIMSYTSAPNMNVISDTGFNYSLTVLSARTLMPMDIEALQYLYGANMSTRSGNSPYTWATNEEMLETIWDGGGIDTIDASNQILTCKIDLRDGQYSSIGLRLTDADIRLGFGLPADFDLNTFGSAVAADLYNGENNVAIAKGAIIENATGGSGNDSILGNSVNNRLLGGAGRDSLTGGLGNDRLDGGTGLDRLSGGGGNDLFDFNRVGETGRTLASADVVTGFVRGSDRIDLSSIDANSTLAGNQDFTFIGALDFIDGAATGQLRFEAGVLYGSNDADATAEFMIKLAGVDTLSAANVVL